MSEEMGKYNVGNDRKANQQNDLDRVLEKISEIVKKSATGDYIYRGETSYHQEPRYSGKVSSGLYREYIDIEAEHFDIEAVQKDILREARDYIPHEHEMKDLELTATLQHYGDKTNLIDFTTDCLVALFFACDGEPEEPGRVILLQKESKDYKVEKPPGIIRRAEMQKSIFVQAPEGFVEPDKDKVVCVPVDLKSALLDHLRRHHDISTKTIYNDLQGFIEKRGLHKSAYTEFYKGLTCQQRANSAKTQVETQCWNDAAIKHYTDATELNHDLTEAYNNRGNVYAEKDDFDRAIQDYNIAMELNPKNGNVYNNRGNAYRNKGDFDRAIQDYNVAIELNPKNAIPHYNRGEAWLHLKKLEKAKINLITAKNKGFDIVDAFRKDYKTGVKEFEEQNDIKLPSDLVGLLGGN